MLNQHLPTYAIVELLIRLSEINPLIGNYKDHFLHEQVVMVKTTTGHINFPVQLIMQQFNDPAGISKTELTIVALSFGQGL